MKKKIYQWHRTTSLIIAIPVMLWAASGFMHPIMTTIRPKVATQFLQASAIDTCKIVTPLQIALSNNHIDSITNFRFVHIDTNWFFQVQILNNNVPLYLSTKTGKRLANGDWLYAQYIAKQFLEGQEKSTQQSEATITTQAVATSSHDCCDAASDCVLNNSKGAKVTNATLVTAFDNEYKSINRLLPVYKVTFARADGIRMYVETTQDRFSFAMDNKRAVFDAVFRWFHTWGWLAFLGKGQFVVELVLVSLAFLTALMGIYIFFVTKTKNVSGNAAVKARRSHRFTSISIALFTLMFTFSGAYHAFNKIVAKKESAVFSAPSFASNSLNLSIGQLQQMVQQPITNISIVAINGSSYWQINTKKSFKQNDGKKPSDLMKTKIVPPPSATYINISNNTVLQNGEIIYASYLASKYSGHQTNDIIKVDTITKFADEYGFVNKRLPVFKVVYNTNHNERYYIETSTGKLALRVDDIDVIEGYSFALLHKHEFMAWAGKPVKDFSTMFWAMAQIAVVAIGLTLYFKMRAKRKQQVNKS